MKESRHGVSSSVVLVVIVVIIAAAFYIEIPMVSTPPSTSTSLPTSVTSSSSSSSTSAISTGQLTFSTPQPLIAAPDLNYTFSLKMVAIGTVSGNYTFSSSGLPSGVTVKFSPSSVNLPAQIGTAVTVTLMAASGAAVSNSTVTLQATAGSSVYSQPFSIMSVQALVLIQGNTFTPNSLTVAAGTKVYWLNLDPSSSPDLGPDMHDVTALDHSFSSGTGDLGQYGIYGHAFTAAGTVPYESAQQGSSMTAQIVVTG